MLKYVADYRVATCMYIHNFKGCSFQGFCGQLAIHEIFILEISLAKVCEHIRKPWLGSVGEQESHE